MGLLNHVEIKITRDILVIAVPKLLMNCEELIILVFLSFMFDHHLSKRHNQIYCLYIHSL